MKKYGIMLIVLLAVVIGGALYWLNKDNTVEVATEEKTTLSPTQVESIVDTVRRGFFGDDQLVRIYYGTLRLGIDMKDVKEGWMKVDEEKDSITCTLPPIRLLDNNFIDEARTKSFFEEGKWTGADRQAMYDRAYTMMKKRCITPVNIQTAQRNAKQQFREMLKAMGFNNVKIEFEK